MAAPTPIDNDARIAALNPRVSFAVTAPAGSGKTGLLTQRLLTLLKTVEYPEEIVAITFTKKAANEMQERIIEALQKTQNSERPSDTYSQKTWDLAHAVLARDIEKNWQLLKNPKRLRIQTIDSFCRSIASQLPFDSLLGATPSTLDNADSAYIEATDKFLQLIESDTPYADDLELLLRHTDNHQGKLESLFVNLLRKREQWLPLIHAAKNTGARKYLEQNLQTVITEHLEKLTEMLLPISSDLCALIDTAACYIEEEAPDSPLIQLQGIVELPTPTADNIDIWLIIANFFLTKSGSYKKSPNKNHGFPPKDKDHKAAFKAMIATACEVAPTLEGLLATTNQLPDAQYTHNEWSILESLTRLLPRLVAELNVTFQSLGATDYTEITLAAITALGCDDEPTDTALKLDHIIKHLLIDEFQDTALPQLQLLERLTAGWEPNDGRTLFIVGDGMQSCYGFRNAKVGLFLDAKINGIGTVALNSAELQVNFRSQAGIIEWVNQTFEHAFPAHDDISRSAVSYNHSKAHKPARAQPAVNVFISDYGDEKLDPNCIDKDQAEKNEALAVAHLVKTAQAEKPTGSIGILVRAKTHLKAIIPTLKAQGIAFQAIDIDPLKSRMVITDLLSLTRAILRFDDRIAWLSILRAPWCGMDLHDLHTLANIDLGPKSPSIRPFNFPIVLQQLLLLEKTNTLSAEGHVNLQRFIAVIEPALKTRQRKTLRATIYGIWVNLGGPACLLDNQDHKNAEQFFELLDAYDKGAQIDDWEGFTCAIDQLYAAPATEGNAKVSIMTLHKSKGLEFDTVIIPGLQKRPRVNDKELLLWHEQLSQEAEAELLLAPISATGSDNNLTYSYIASEKKLQEEYEATRLLYVGCTRAIEQLHLLACLKHTEDKPCQQQTVNGLLASIWDQVNNDLRFVHSLPIKPTQKITQNNDSKQHWILRLPSTWQSPKASDNTQLCHLRRGFTHDEFDKITENLPEKESNTTRILRQTGIIIHQILEYLSLSPLPTNIEQWLALQAPLWRRLLSDKNITGNEQTQAFMRIEQAIKNTLNDPDGRWLLDCDHEGAGSEVSFTQAHKSCDFREHILDRTFIHQGTRWIIDYKSSQPTDDENTETFITAECAAYQAQLTRYQQLFDRSSKIALYFPLLSAQKRLICLN